jgi:hypothetical protein
MAGRKRPGKERAADWLPLFGDSGLLRARRIPNVVLKGKVNYTYFWH